MVEVERTSVPNSSPLIPPPTALAPPEIAGPSSMSQRQFEHILVTSRDLFNVMDAIRTCAATSASLAASQTALIRAT